MSSIHHLAQSVLTFNNDKNLVALVKWSLGRPEKTAPYHVRIQDWRLRTVSRPLFLTDSFPLPFSCRAGSWPVSWWSTATRARSWAGRNLWRRKQLRRLLSLQRATLSTTGAEQCELTSHQLTTFTEVLSAWLTGGDTFTTTVSQTLDLKSELAVFRGLNVLSWFSQSLLLREEKWLSVPRCCWWHWTSEFEWNCLSLSCWDTGSDFLQRAAAASWRS